MKKDTRGSSLIITVISFVVILGFTSLVTDIGLTLYEKQKLSNGLDATALAGAQNIYNDDYTVKNIVREYAALNNINSDDLIITIASDRKGLEVESSKTIKYFFAKVLGINQNKVTFRSVVRTEPITSISGIRPLAVPNQTFVYGAQYILKEGAGDGYSGNYGAISLGNNGASTYEYNLLNGYSGTINIGDALYTETGNISQTTRRAVQQLINSDPYSDYTNFKKDSKRLIIIPVVNTLQVDGKKPIYVLGFAAFFLEGFNQSGGHTEIIGRFVKHVARGNSSNSGNNYGLLGVKLVK